MKIAYNPSNGTPLSGVPSDNTDIIFDLSGMAIYARGVKFAGTDTTYGVFTSTTTGLVPVPGNNGSNRFLREDGEWVVPAGSSYNTMTLEEAVAGTSTDSRVITAKVLHDKISSTTHTSDHITALTGYSKPESTSVITTEDSLNTALGKLEYKADTAYLWMHSITSEDTDDIINKWHEVVNFLDEIQETTLNNILSNYVYTVTTDGTGNAVTDVSKNGNTITVTKGNSFLPLSGGIISGSYGALIINRNSSSVVSTVRYTNADGILGMIGMNTDYEPIVYKGSSESNPNIIIHSGNYSSYALPLSSYTAADILAKLKTVDGSGSGLDADLLDGKSSGMYGQWLNNIAIDLNVIRDGFRAGKLNNAPNSAPNGANYRGFLEYGCNNYVAQFNSDNINNLYYRWCENGTWKDWRTVAFTDSNVASATNADTVDSFHIAVDSSAGTDTNTIYFVI